MAINSNSSRFREIASASLAGIGIVGAADIHFLAGGSTTAGYSYWANSSKQTYFNSAQNINTALAKMTTGRNDVLLVSPDSHAQAAAVVWSKAMCHLVGMYGPALQNHRSRIGHSVTVSPLLTVSGNGCTIANLYFPYGLANATDLNLLRVTGPRNSFINCHFLPTDATPLDEATFALVKIESSETYFKNCYFGGDTVAWTNGTMIDFVTTADPPRVVFEDCMFVMNADNAQVTFLKTTAGLGRATMIFKNCLFLNLGTSLTLAITGAGLGNAKMLFDINCTFAGVTDIVAAANEASVWCGHGGWASADLLNNMIASHPDLS